MTVREYLDLNSFAPAIEQLAAQVDSVASDEKLIADASVALSSGIAAMAVFQTTPAGPPVGNWEGALDDHSLCLFSATHQFVFTLENSMFQSAVLSGPAGNTWNIIRSDRGLYVQVTDISAEVVKDRLIKTDGSIVDAADTTSAMQELKAEWQKIDDMPEAGLPAYIPECDLFDVDLPDIESLPDVNSSLPDGGEDPGPSDGGPSGSGGSSSGGSPADSGVFPFPKDSSSGSASSDFVGKAVDAAGNLLKGAAAVAVAGVVGRAVQSAGRSASDTSSAQHKSPPDSVPAKSVVSGSSQSSDVSAELVLEITGAAPVIVNVFPWVLGRSNDCQMPLSSRLVSRRHAQIVLHEDQICFEDLGSSNGSWLNGEKPEGKMPIYKGDELKIADVQIKIVDGPQKPEPDSGNLATMMFNISDALNKTQETPTLADPLPSSLPPKPAKPLKHAPPILPASHPKPAAPLPPALPPRPAKPLRPASSIPPAPPPRPARPLPPAAPLPPAPSPRPAEPLRPATPPPPPFLATEDNIDDYVARAAQVARDRSDDFKRSDKPAKQGRDQRSPQQPDEVVSHIKQAEPEDFKPSLSSVRWVSFIFGFFFLADNLRFLSAAGSAALEQQSFLLSAVFGAATVFFAFIAGSSRGFFRFLTLVSSGAYIGNKLYYSHAVLLSIVEKISKDTSLVQDNPMILLPLLSIITAAWIAKRASGR